MPPGPTDPLLPPSRTSDIVCKYFEYEAPHRSNILVQGWIWKKQLQIRRQLTVKREQEEAASTKLQAQKVATYEQRISILESELKELDQVKSRYFNLLRQIIKTEEQERQKREAEATKQPPPQPSSPPPGTDDNEHRETPRYMTIKRGRGRGDGFVASRGGRGGWVDRGRGRPWSNNNNPRGGYRSYGFRNSQQNSSDSARPLWNA
ncbi:hypothetical protein RCL1_000937 [Eukaryota sp. TZLM3-RCL]